MEDRLHYKRVRLLVDGLIYGAASPCSFAVFPHGTVVLYSGADFVAPQCVANNAEQYLRSHTRSAECPTAYHVSGSIWLLCLETNGPMVIGVYFSQSGDDDGRIKPFAKQGYSLVASFH